ncbi:MerR family transcriptional regulator [Actinoplanes sp. NPDC051513]|uniref:MerR family transcriptional regulator n=1 Tax=Actinoplanes sp. NPDC051513 TaxID=3363908 RepID=UPI0037BBD202
MIEPPLLRIGELSRRLGVSEHVLRAWERRYGVLRPVRSAGGFRLYSETDLQRIRRMQAFLSDGLSAAEAARAAVNEERSQPVAPVGPTSGLAAEAATLARALDGYDEPAAQAALDRLFGTLTVETVLRDVLLPYLHELGERWKNGAASVAQEHFASNVIRGRLAGLGRGWGHGQGPQAVLACAPDEQHDIALLAFGVVLNRHGWRIGYLGASTPVDDLVRLAAATHPDLVVVSATRPERLAPLTAQLTRLAGTAPLALAGPGATSELADTVGARLLTGDPVTAAQNVRAR